MAGQQEIVIVEDDTSMSQAIDRLLSTAGWNVRSFTTAEDFLESDRCGSTTFLILDIHLPRMSGIELCQHLISTGVAPPFIFITGHDRPFIRQMAEQLGATAYLVKPFSGHELLETVRNNLILA